MPALYSDQLQKVANAGNSLISGLVERAAYAKRETFTRNTTNATYGNVANGDTIALCRLPKGAIIVGGSFVQAALGTSVTATIAVGSQNLITAGTSVAAAANTPLASTIALGYGHVVPADTDVILTIGGATPTGGVAIAGHIDYVCN